VIYKRDSLALRKSKHFVTTTKCLVLSTKRFVAAAQFLVAVAATNEATKNYLLSLILLPLQNHFFPCTLFVLLCIFSNLI